MVIFNFKFVYTAPVTTNSFERANAPNVGGLHLVTNHIDLLERQI